MSPDEDTLSRAELLAGFTLHLIDAGVIGPSRRESIADDVAGYLALLDVGDEDDDTSRVMFLADVSAHIRGWLTEAGR